MISEDLSREILPVHEVQTHYNILMLLEKSVCINCVKIGGITPSGTGTILVDIEIKHPFASPGLTGFDVRGIAMFNGTKQFPVANVVTSNKAVHEAELVNADGFTTLNNITTEGSGPGGIRGCQQGNLAQGTPDSTLNGFMR
jgi:hypothetical protein